jgi:hypothetical protein
LLSVLKTGPLRIRRSHFGQIRPKLTIWDQTWKAMGVGKGWEGLNDRLVEGTKKFGSRS